VPDGNILFIYLEEMRGRRQFRMFLLP